MTSTGDGDLWRPLGEEKSGEGELEFVRKFWDIVRGMIDRKVLKVRRGDPGRAGDRDRSGHEVPGAL